MLAIHVAALILTVFAEQNANGRPEHDEFLETEPRFKALRMDCDLCHISPGSNFHNDYGATLARLLTRRNADAGALLAAVRAADKEPSLFAGRTYGDRIDKKEPPAHEATGEVPATGPVRPVPTGELISGQSPPPNFDVLLSLLAPADPQDKGAIDTLLVVDMAERNRRAAAGFRRLGPLATVPLANTLLGADEFLRGRAADALSVLDPEARRAVLNLVLPRLIASLAQKDVPARRKAAAAALGVLRQDAAPAVPALRELLKDQDWSIRAAAVQSLGRVGAKAEEVVPALQELLSDREWLVRYRAAVSLGEFGESAGSAAAALGKALKDECDPVQNAAAQALALIGPAAATQLAPLGSARK